MSRVVRSDVDRLSAFRKYRVSSLEKTEHATARRRSTCIGDAITLCSFSYVYLICVRSVKSTSSKLLRVQLNVVPANQCNGSYASSVGRNLTRGIDGDSQICAGYSQGGKDTCGVRRFLFFNFSAPARIRSFDPVKLSTHTVFTKPNHVITPNTQHFSTLDDFIGCFSL